MQETRSSRLRNWKGSITAHPAVVVFPESVEEIARVLCDPRAYPAPVRAVGSNHSTTRCAVADGGTVVDMTRMNRILEIRGDTVTAQAGALYIDVAQELEKRGLQFYVNVELGNLSLGSACSGGTKDASMPGELGQVNSYAIGIKLVLPNGEQLEVTEDDPELLQIVRSSYGLLGIIYEVTFRVKPLRPMAVEHRSYSLDGFIEALPALKAGNASLMLFLFPFLDRVLVELRRDSQDTRVRNRILWRFRNWAWKRLAPGYGYVVSRTVPFRGLRSFLIDAFNFSIQKGMGLLLGARSTSPADQIIRYPDEGDWTSYTFSIWAFPEEEYPEHLRAYYQFCREHYRKSGFRCDMLNVGYRIARDDSSLFSYTAGGTALTLDPVATGQPGWDGFIDAYNEFCSERGGTPLFNQTKSLRPEQARRAFGKQLARFEEIRKRYDPGDRLLNDYFHDMLR